MNDTVEHPQIPAFVLVRPQMGENIGAAARAMWNFGLDRMRIVAPRDSWPNPSAVA
ncbi:MAG TPA: RNA methyltransferase, partial [Sulfitobacter pontiacus]|nr:RNA methyltransferase [Sulfitobacter pontiacus]